MKKILFLLLFVFNSFAYSAGMTFNEIILQKNSQDRNGIIFVTYSSAVNWCAYRGFSFTVGTFEVAQTLDGLADGLFRCSGKFSQVPTLDLNPIQIFAIDNCSAINPRDLEATCPAPRQY